MALIYWVHLREDEDYLSDGYIGITDRKLNERMNEHKIEEHHDFFQDIIDYHGWDNLIKEVIYENNICECRSFEYYLRPNRNIGWNSAAGGGLPPNHKGKKRSEEFCKKLSNNKKGNKYKLGLKHNEETIKKMKDYKKSKEHNNKVRIALIGNKNKLGYKLTEENKNNIRIAKLDKKIYKFKNGSIIELCTRSELISKYNLNNSCLSMVINGSRPHHKGWIIIED